MEIDVLLRRDQSEARWPCLTAHVQLIDPNLASELVIAQHFRLPPLAHVREGKVRINKANFVESTTIITSGGVKMKRDAM